MSRFEGAAVLVTGGSRGIGRATAAAFAAAGARVAITSRSAAGREVAERLSGHFVQSDVRVAEECRAAVTSSLERFGRLDVLVNNAGVIYRGRTVEETTEEEWDATFDTNVKGAWLMSRAAMPSLREGTGSIVNVASYVGLVGFRGAAAYAASKAALVSLTKTMALDHADQGVRVNCVCPGSVGTDMIFDAWRSADDPDEARRRWEEKHPVGRIATPAEVAAAILFLASDQASFITGVALPVDGGITAG